MALKRPERKQLSEEAKKQILTASSQQTGKVQAIKSWDNDYPAFDVPINQKVLVYIPNHVVMEPDGSMDLLQDKFAAHAVIDGRTFNNVRCSQGVFNEELGLDGTCPLCDGMNEVWDLYHKEYAELAKSRGIDVNSPDAEATLKAERTELLKNMAIKTAEQWYTFPIVVIECEVDANGNLTTKPKLDANKHIHGTPMFYQIRKRTYDDKWKAGFDSIDTDGGDAPTSPAGMWAVLNFTYTPKSGNCDKMGSARALKVGFKTMSGYEQWAKAFDEMTEDWTPFKAIDVLVLNALRSMDEMREVADTVLKPVRDKLAMLALGSSGVATAPTNKSADEALSNFGAEEVESGGALPDKAGEASGGELPAGNLTSEMPNVGV